MRAACSIERSGRKSSVGRDAEIEVLAQPVADEAAGAGQGAPAIPSHCRLVAQHRDEDLGHSDVAWSVSTSVTVTNPESRVLQLTLQEIGHLLLRSAG